MNKDVRAHLKMAREALREAENLLLGNLPRGAASRAYYAIFHAASAVLSAQGERYASHEAVKARFGELFSKTRQIDPKFHRYLLDAFELRHNADYEVDVESPVSIGDVEPTLRKAHEFVAMAEDFLKGAGEKLE